MTIKYRQVTLELPSVCEYFHLEDRRICSPESAIAYFGPIFASKEYNREIVLTAHVNGQNRVTSFFEAALGSQDQCYVDPKVILRAALADPLCGGLILAHNHPSGDVTPSTPDNQLTRMVATACRALGMRFLDHVIIGLDPMQAYSYRRSNPDILKGMSCY